MSFGKVSMEELQMTRYEKDSTAEAVILFDIGSLEGTTSRFKRSIRVKVLKKSGLKWGNWIFNTPTKGDFKVAVFNLVDGQIVKEKTESSSIYKEEIVKEFEVYKVFAPSVRVGTVIDIHYEYNGVPFEWRFQETIPIAYSELTLEPTEYLHFTKTYFGSQPLETVSPTKWRAREVPAFKIEPYLNHYSNYISKFIIQLESISTNGFFFGYSNSWRTIIDNLYRTEHFGGTLGEFYFLNDVANTIKKKNLPVDKAIEEAYTYIQNNVKWNGVKTIFATTKFKSNIMVNHSANNAEINMALMALLNKIGINTIPVVLSTRDHGLIAEFAPGYNRLNYMIAYVDHENTRLLLDATSEFTIPGILPRHCLNGRGLLVKQDNEQWFDLAGKNKEMKSQFTEITIGEQGEALATINRDFYGYGFLDWVEELKEHNQDAETMKHELQKEYPKIRIEDYNIVVKNKQQLNGKETIKADVTDQLIDGGDEYLFNPFVFFEYSDNPFKSETRNSPVDLGCPKEVKNIIRVKFPNNIEVKQIPPSVKFATPNDGASFTFFANQSAGKLEFMALLKLSKPIYTEVEYLELRKFFSEVIKFINTPVIFSKKT